MEWLQRLDTWAALITLAAVAWFLGVRPLLDWLNIDVGEVLRRLLSSRVSGGSLNRYVEREAPLPPVRPADRGLSAGLSASSAPLHPALRAIILDTEADKPGRQAATTRAALIRALVAAGWRTGEIRVLLRGDTTVVTEEIRAARLALGVGDEEAPKTPLAGRPIPPGVEFADESA